VSETVEEVRRQFRDISAELHELADFTHIPYLIAKHAECKSKGTSHSGQF